MAGNSPGARIEVTGAKELRAALKRMGANVSDMSAIHKEVGQRIAEEARSRAPYVSGKLSKSIRGGGNKTRAYVSAGRSRTVPYAGPIHFGWLRHNIAPNPFLYDALDARKDEVVGLYSKRIGDLVEKVGRETP